MIMIIDLMIICSNHTYISYLFSQIDLNIKMLQPMPINDDDVWTVTPSPGYCIKFRQVYLNSTTFPNANKYKFFINICTCNQLPPPTDDIDEVSLITDIIYLLI